MTQKVSIILLLVLSACQVGHTQDKWDLRRCVEYAWANNISVRQSDIQARIAAVGLEQSKWAQYPTASFGTNTGIQFGRSIDPTTNQFTTTQLLFQGFNLSFGVQVFNWNQIRNSIISSRFQEEASRADVEKIKNDIGLSVASFYLQALLSREQANIARVQMEQTYSQLQATRKRVEAGALPELNALTLESQYANDSSSMIAANTLAAQNLLSLKALLNIDASQSFDIETPPVDQIPVEPIAELQPETVFSLAVKNQPAQKANELRIKSFEASMKAARAALYPTISVGGSLGTNFASPRKQVTGFNFVGYKPADPLGPVALVNGNNYPILSPDFVITQGNKSFSELWSGWGTQIDNNFRQSIGLSISVPINNGGVARFNQKRTKLNYENALVTRDQADQKLKNDIYTAYYNSVAALEKYNASKISVDAFQKTYDYSGKRYDLGLLSTFELITAQNNLTRSKLDLLYSHYDYVFKMKVLEFYKGMGLRLK